MNPSIALIPSWPVLAFSEETVTLELNARLEAGVTETEAFPEALPPRPSNTVTEIVNEVTVETMGGVKTALVPLPATLPPELAHEYVRKSPSGSVALTVSALVCPSLIDVGFAVGPEVIWGGLLLGSGSDPNA